MRCVGCDDPYYWNEAHKALFRTEREKLKKRMEELSRSWETFEEEKRQLNKSLEEERDLELDPDFPHMVERALMKIVSKQDVLRRRLEELIKRLNALENEEKQLHALLTHEKYAEWVELKKRRDKAAEEVERLDAEMKQLMETIMHDASAK
jgi:DNA repair exonuclease SbcCD ATPase subunit